MQSPRVFGCLQEPWYHRRVVDLYGGCLFFETDIGRVRQVVSLPPALLLTFTSEAGHSITFGLVGDFVQFTQVANVTKSSYAVSSLHSTDLARGAQEPLSYLFYRKAFFITERAQEGSEFAAANGRIAHIRHEIGRASCRER